MVAQWLVQESDRTAEGVAARKRRFRLLASSTPKKKCLTGT
jgi:hypothetical protein